MLYQCVWGVFYQCVWGVFYQCEWGVFYQCVGGILSVCVGVFYQCGVLSVCVGGDQIHDYGMCQHDQSLHVFLVRRCYTALHTKDIVLEHGKVLKEMATKNRYTRVVM